MLDSTATPALGTGPHRLHRSQTTPRGQRRRLDCASQQKALCIPPTPHAARSAARHAVWHSGGVDVEPPQAAHHSLFEVQPAAPRPVYTVATTLRQPCFSMPAVPCIVPRHTTLHSLRKRASVGFHRSASAQYRPEPLLQLTNDTPVAMAPLRLCIATGTLCIPPPRTLCCTA